MADEERGSTSDAVSKLIKLTQQGKLRWHASNPDGDLISDDSRRIRTVLRTRTDAGRLRLVSFRQRVDQPDYMPLYSAVTLARDYLQPQKKYPYWYDGVALEFEDEGHRGLWQFPNHSALSDLLEAVKYQVAGVGDFLKSLDKLDSES